ncbi:hypothetical protein [Pontibacter sp. H249]|uniref:hypothetical protein n=1 Tax=Pontibacter sp. H249 TaxID=3133420 RepID=UPI0030C21227
MRNLLILHKTQETDLQRFIDFWSRLYRYPLERLYNNTITKSQFDPDDIQSLFKWKNGMDLSSRKQQSLDTKIKSQLKVINQMKLQAVLDVECFLAEFSGLTAVWKIFLLHIIKPLRYPIYDQHINRAYNFVHDLEYRHISASGMTCRTKEDFYFNTYLPFIRNQGSINLKKLDEAFFALGRFLATSNNALLLEK